MREFLIELRYLILLQGNILDVYSHKYAKVRINFGVDLPLEKTITMHNVTILIESVFNENHNHYYYKLFVENFSRK